MRSSGTTSNGGALGDAAGLTQPQNGDGGASQSFPRMIRDLLCGIKYQQINKFEL